MGEALSVAMLSHMTSLLPTSRNNFFYGITMLVVAPYRDSTLRCRDTSRGYNIRPLFDELVAKEVEKEGV